MNTIKLTLGGSNHMTLLSNIFIDYYMKDANEMQIKLYLYLLRSTSAGLAADLSVLADFLNYPETDILRALRYWERRGVISLSFSSARKVSGDAFSGEDLMEIRLEKLSTPSAPAAEMPAAPAIPETREIPAPVQEHAPVTQLPAEKEEDRILPQLPDPDLTKESYSLNELKEFKNDPDTSLLLTAAQQYIGRPLSPSHIRSLLYLYKGLGMSTELIDYLLQYCIDNGQNSFHYIEASALGWVEQGITTVEEAKKRNSKAPDKETRHIMQLLGRKGDPTPQESRLIRRWLKNYALPMTVIEEACNRTVLAVEANRFAYAESILRQWHEKGIKSIADVQAADEAFRQSRIPQGTPVKAGTATTPKKSSSTFCDIETQDYDFTDLEKKLINN